MRKIELRKEVSDSPKVRISKSELEKTPEDLLSAFELISVASKDSGLSKQFFKKVKSSIDYVCERLSVNEMQAVLLAYFVEHSDDRQIRLIELAEYLKCSKIKIMKNTTDIEDLERRRIIRCSRNEGYDAYRIPKLVVEAFSHNEAYVAERYENLDFWGLFNRLDVLFNEKESSELTFSALSQEVEQLFEDNSHLEFVQRLQQLDYDDDDIILLLFFCHKHVNNHDDMIVGSDYDELYDNRIMCNCVRSALSKGFHILVVDGWLEYTNQNGVADRNTMCLSSKSRIELFGDVKISSDNATDSSILKCEDMTKKEMFYNDNVVGQVNHLTSLLGLTKFAEVCARLKDKGLRQGFACLFYGSPGTGKTETVYQIARETGRDIMQVNISSIKSCWVGESEKNIKALFDRYRQMVQKSEATPILLFNEADAIIGKRMSTPQRAVDKMENSIQNIILQEIENLEGILIATTNLTQSLDRAFERRFIYKIRFDKPDVMAKQSIWKSMLPEVSDDDALQLASRYDFIGGQIENIARKFMVDSILYGDVPADKVLTELSRHCEAELLVKPRPQLGFRQCG